MINETMARLSNDLMLWTVVAYSLGMLGFAVEFAASRRGGRSDTNAVRSRRFGTAAIGFVVIGWATHVSAAVTRGLAVHRAPWGNMYEFSMMASLVAITLFLVLFRRYQLRALGVFILAPIILYLGLAGTVLYAEAGPVQPALHSYWIWIHVAAGIFSTGAYQLAGIIAVLYLLKDRWERGLPPLRVAAGRGIQSMLGRSPRVSLGPGTAAVAEFRATASETAVEPEQRYRSGLMESLPPARALERASHRIITFAFPIWTFAIIAGAIWASSAWSRYWGWDPKETWSFITWLAYAAYLHACATAGWRGRRAAMLSLVGLSCLIVNFYVINIFVHGLHSYAGLPGSGGGIT